MLVQHNFKSHDTMQAFGKSKLAPIIMMSVTSEGIDLTICDSVTPSGSFFPILVYPYWLATCCRSLSDSCSTGTESDIAAALALFCLCALADTFECCACMMAGMDCLQLWPCLEVREQVANQFVPLSFDKSQICLVPKELL